MGIRFWLKLFGGAMVVLGIIAGIGTLDDGMGMREGGVANLLVGLTVLVFMVSIGLLMHGVAEVLEQLDEKGNRNDHSAGDQE